MKIVLTPRNPRKCLKSLFVFLVCLKQKRGRHEDKGSRKDGRGWGTCWIRELGSCWGKGSRSGGRVVLSVISVYKMSRIRPEVKLQLKRKKMIIYVLDRQIGFWAIWPHWEAEKLRAETKGWRLQVLRGDQIWAQVFPLSLQPHPSWSWGFGRLVHLFLVLSFTKHFPSCWLAVKAYFKRQFKGLHAVHGVYLKKERRALGWLSWLSI